MVPCAMMPVSVLTARITEPVKSISSRKYSTDGLMRMRRPHASSVNATPAPPETASGCTSAVVWLPMPETASSAKYGSVGSGSGSWLGAFSRATLRSVAKAPTTSPCTNRRGRPGQLCTPGVISSSGSANERCHQDVVAVRRRAQVRIRAAP